MILSETLEALKLNTANDSRRTMQETRHNTAQKMYEEVSLHSLATMGQVEMIEMLLSSGVNVNTMDNDHSTPLHWAAMSGKSAVVELLITRGADVNARDTYLGTPLHWVQDIETATVLISHGADVKAEDAFFNKPLNWAKAQGYADIEELLKQHMQ